MGVSLVSKCYSEKEERVATPQTCQLAGHPLGVDSTWRGEMN